MTVKEIFELRKQGRIEEAYEAIRPIYATHKGHYTTLCMFWVAADVFKLRLEQGRVEEAEKIYLALKRVIPSIEDDKEKSAAGFMRLAESKLIRVSEKFRRRYFAIRGKTKKDVPHQVLEEKDVPQISQKAQKGTVPGENEGIKISAISAISAGPKESVPSVESVRPNVSAGQSKVLECIRVNPGWRIPRISESTNIPSKSIERHVKVLVAQGLIEHRGSKKTGGYFAL